MTYDGVTSAADLAALAADRTHDLHDEAALRRLYSTGPGETSLAKVVDHVHPLYRPYIEASPFAVLATVGAAGIDTSPRGDGPGFVRVADAHTLLLPDRRGNQRIDSLRNIARDPRVALLFLVPASAKPCVSTATHGSAPCPPCVGSSPSMAKTRPRCS